MKEPEFRYLDLLEGQLRRSLRPVTPDPVFVSHLQDHLASPGRIVLEQPGRGMWVGAGVFSILMLTLGVYLAILFNRRSRT